MKNVLTFSFHQGQIPKFHLGAQSFEPFRLGEVDGISSHWKGEKLKFHCKDWGQEEKGVTKDEMAGWHHQLNEH